MDIHQQIDELKGQYTDNSMAGDFARGFFASLSALYQESSLQDVVNWWNWADDGEASPFWGLVGDKWIVISTVYSDKGQCYELCPYITQGEYTKYINPTRIIRLIDNIPTPNEILGL